MNLILALSAFYKQNMECYSAVRVKTAHFTFVNHSQEVVMIEATVGHLLREGLTGLEILLGERANEPFKGKLIGPGGKFKPGENTLDCVRREMEEETGVVIVDESAIHMATVDYYYPAAHSEKLRWRVHYFTISRWNGFPAPLDGLRAICWAHLGSLPYHKMPMDVQWWWHLMKDGSHPLMAEIHYKNAAGTEIMLCKA